VNARLTPVYYAYIFHIYGVPQTITSSERCLYLKQIVVVVVVVVVIIIIIIIIIIINIIYFTINEYSNDKIQALITTWQATRKASTHRDGSLL